MERISINTDFIKLDQFLKWCGITTSGVEAKLLVVNGHVKVNGLTEMQRGKKIRKGDIIEVEGNSFQVD